MTTYDDLIKSVSGIFPAFTPARYITKRSKQKKNMLFPVAKYIPAAASPDIIIITYTDIPDFRFILSVIKSVR